MKRSPFKYKPKEFRKGDGKPRHAPKRSITRSKGPSLPKWVRAIPESQSHGSGTLQKRLWRVVSDSVRIRDWYKYNGRCVASGAKIGYWSEGDAGHWKSYASCNGLFKFNPMNIHLQSKSSNGWGGQEIGHSFGEELKKRYGPIYLDHINESNRLEPLKFSKEQILSAIVWTIKDIGSLPDKPSYYDRVISLMSDGG